ncbi:hypothetical protein LCI18_013720 [Fusarium solani-melongenae]|uniref:Uncharacterized protein n=1 Tax=Fusarium solani subsp. cucurbitae TaxID=2747967 RepID=A0ACD3ZNI4_FUSSC|nr:hypothetical protein LCI18_013720 [Fusarium solani-melongenae]
MRTLIGQSQDDSVTELDSDFYFSQDRNELGCTPSLEDVNDILQAAAECQGNFHAEPGWNMLVHSELPDGVINHTDYYPLRDRPIALSIETKRTGEGWDGATLQLSVWQAAHWRLLDLLNSDREDEPAPLPGFLPGIIIQGHGWYLVLATRENMKTVCWNKINIGSTDSVIRVYQTICGL